jgi:hypothetical protein
MRVKNPWRLSLAEVDAMDAICKFGTTTDAAKMLKIKRQSVSCAVAEVKAKMGVDKQLLAALEWDRWRQTDGKGVPA